VYMKRVFSTLATNTRGQDLLEYALLVGMLATIIGFVVPKVTTRITTISTRFSEILVHPPCHPLPGQFSCKPQ